ncbi:hypothetical protein MLD38_008162 [Melastoma candidum]|uniref:Uncharacterized protein n=1 Tax=Melastoma candidum TaxID=119954 RepID=A0ACB9RTL3_9MYRT|nr:hypothetical protein MLD38_008162 [Melastoma candidum]
MGLVKGSSFATLSPEFRAFPHQFRRRRCLPFRKKRFVARSYFGETFPGSVTRGRGLETHCDSNCGVTGGDSILDEEYWTAAWLRAEAYLESASYTRHVDNYKRNYAEQEFYALRRRCLGRDGNYLKCFCFVTVKMEDKNIRRTVLSSVVGTLDLSIRQYLQGETYPGEARRISAVFARREPFDAHKYAYIANVCVSKFMRCQGVASNMIYLATDVANLAGMKQLFVHVSSDNIAARKLYQKTGFQIVEAASQTMSEDRTLLMLLEL